MAIDLLSMLSQVFGPYGLQLRKMFYLVTPWETTYPSLEETPFVLDEAIPWFFFLIGLELFACWKKKMKDAYDMNDFLACTASGFVQTMLNKVAMGAVELSLYVWVYENWAIYRLPPESAWTWLIAFFVVDFFYYWMHRMAHEVNIFWAIHQMHHSSEYFNLGAALRQGVFQQIFARVVYLPQALFIPPSQHMAHEALNRLYQFWTHTPVVGRLGPLEWVFNTPSHHRVHHGRNRYCIDKNYAGTLIIWDRLFGTFQPELDSEPVVYGLTHNVNTIDPFKSELGHLVHIFFEKVPAMDGLINKAKAIFYGPGWSPGKPRTGDLADIPEIEYPVVKYHSGVASWVSAYVLFQGAITLLCYKSFLSRMKALPWLINLEFAATTAASYYIVGNALEKKQWFPYFEILRCALLYYRFVPISWPEGAIRVIMQTGIILSAALWIVVITASRKKIKIYVNGKAHKE